MSGQPLRVMEFKKDMNCPAVCPETHGENGEFLRPPTPSTEPAVIKMVIIRLIPIDEVGAPDANPENLPDVTDLYPYFGPNFRVLLESESDFIMPNENGTDQMAQTQIMDNGHSDNIRNIADLNLMLEDFKMTEGLGDTGGHNTQDISNLNLQLTDFNMAEEAEARFHSSDALDDDNFNASLLQ
ncbi:hypothetical protein M406DRAFT_71430 [Cryphonectria parasitica EP155]|uniref:Uncharacterized protein n=1 Tax=Cryphonectria parasitica (strain ATCC 38755 / EP155) TaxID=660469 RepID=A0A9P4Y8Q9_CRYP1|nr:uncharacterized protein M406DRAFT_71430 [Cryphonectria parasitica EP155]KAF3768417.1 hypothetical protein M406DRAFT_71430 [Cryphonectria parasitica EP155]